jgi:hypothetical protein
MWKLHTAMIIHYYTFQVKTTHIIEPVDKSVFGPCEHYLDEFIRLFYNYITDRNLTKRRFGKIFTEVRDKASTPANIKAEFRTPGIYPFKHSLITDEHLLPSLVAHNEGAQVSNVVTLIEMPAHALLSQKT